MAKKNNNIMEQNAAVEKKTKQSYVKELRKMLTEGRITDESLKSKVESTLSAFDKDMTKVSKQTIVDLCNEVVVHVAQSYQKEAEQTPAPAPKEASLKPKKKGGITKSKKSEEVPETAEDESAVTEDESTEEEKPVKKTGKKSSLKKSNKDSKKQAEVESIPAASNVGADFLPSAKMFPAEIDHPELGKLIACTGDYTEYADILKALNDEESPKTLYFAAYWTKRHIKEYQYANVKMVNPKTVKNGFPLDLDILMAVLPCETMERVYAMSRYTEALFQFEGEDFQYVEDTDPRGGDKFRIRVSAGMEFEIYRPADEEVVTAK